MNLLGPTRLVCHPERSEGSRDCFVAPLLAMTFGVSSAFRSLVKLELPVELRNYLRDKKISLGGLSYFERFSPEVLNLFSGLAVQLRPSLSLFKEIAKNIYETARREEKEVEVLLKELKILEILEHSGERREKLEKIRTLLYERRFPEISKLNQTLQKEIEKLSPPPFLKVKWDKTFEKEGIKLELNLANEKELEKALEELSKPNFKKVFKKIWEEF